MKSRAARLALLVLFVLALGVTTFLFLKSEAAQRTQIAAGQTFSDGARTAARSVLQLRTAQQAYVANGQDEDFWTKQVLQMLPVARDGLARLHETAVSGEARTQIEAATGSLQDFGQMDARAREYVRTGNRLTASDMIFANGSELADLAVAAIDRAALSELDARAAAAATFERRQRFALVAAAAASGLVVLLLFPSAEREIPVPSFRDRADPQPLRAVNGPLPKPMDPSVTEGWSAPKLATQSEETVIAAGPEPITSETTAPAESPVGEERLLPAAAAPATSTLDFTAVATLCTELSRIDDTIELLPLLEDAARLLDASGIILWMADPDGRELSPVLVQGYPPHLVNRLGTIPRHAENATAAAFRTGLLQTVNADEGSDGAIAVPLMTCGGCVGVMAAEVRGRSETHHATLAAATILSAQLASLVGPAGRASEAPVEAANA